MATSDPEWAVGYTDGMNNRKLASSSSLYRKGFEEGQKEWASRNGIDPQPLVEFDPVKIPGHYNSGSIEVANFITDQELNYPRGNVVKYVSRAGKKDPAKELEDLEKAAAYLQMAHNLASGKPAVVRDPETQEVVWTLFR